MMIKLKKLKLKTSAVAIGMACASLLVVGSIFTADALNTQGDGKFTVAKNSYSAIDDKSGLLLTTERENATYLLAEKASDVFEIEGRAIPATQGSSDFTRITFSIVDDATQIGLNLYLEEYYSGENRRYEFGVGPTHPDRTVGKEHGNYRALTDVCAFDGTGEIIRFGYDIYEKEVFYYKNSSREVFLDLDDESQLATMSTNITFPEFSTYSVSVNISGIKGEDAKFLLYSLNGQSLGGETFTNSAGAVLCGEPKLNNAVVGKEVTFSLEGLKTYDVLDGFKEEFKGKLSVTDPNGLTTVVENNTFTPDMAGDYVLVVSARDSQGFYGTKRYFDFYAYGAEPETEISFAYELENTVLGKGGKLYLPSAKAESVLTLTGEKPSLELLIKKGTSAVATLDATKGNEYVFAEEGAYTVEYLSESIYGSVKTVEYDVEVTADAPTFEVKGDMEESYPLNSVFTLPSATANGKSAVSGIVFPNGSMTTARAVKLDETGQYAVVYKAEVAGKTYSYTRNFSVFSKSSDLFENIQGVTIENYATTPKYCAEESKGVKLTAVRENATVRTVSPINITDNTTKDNVVKFLFTPEMEGNHEFTSLVITLTDAENEDIFVKVKYQRGTLGEGQCMTARARTNKMSDYVNYGDLKNSSQSIKGVFSGTFTHLKFGKFPSMYVAFNYDYATHTVYSSISNDASEYNRRALCLTEEESVGVGNVFEGFPSGFAYVSVSFEKMVASKANLMLMELDGQDLTKEYVEDTAAPNIAVNYGEYSENNLPQGVVGKTYPIFPAKAIDVVDGTCVYDVKVYYVENGKEIRFYGYDVKGFTPDRKGEYRIVYSAKDGRDNYAEKKVSVWVEAVLAELSYTVDMPTTGRQGYFIDIPEGLTTGGSGKVAVTTEICLDGTQIAMKEGGFLPKKGGTYTVAVTLTDFLQTTKTLKYTIEVAGSTAPILVERNLPSAVFVGKEFTFAEWIAYDYADGEEKTVPVTVKVNGETLSDDCKWTPTAEGNYSIEFSATNSLGSVTKTYMIPAVSLTRESVFIANYFYRENAEIGREESYTFIPFLATAANAKVTFINAISAKGLSLNFAADKANNQYDGIRVTVTDSKNLEQKLVFEIEKSLEGSIYSIFTLNGVEGQLQGSFFDGTNVPYVLNYDDKTYEITDYSGKKIGEAKNSDGSDWTGFESGKVYVSYEFINPTANQAVIQIGGIANHTFSTSANKDNIAPYIVVGSINKVVTYGEKVTLAPAYAYDVLGSVQSFEMSLRTPSGKELFTSNDPTQGVEFTVDEYGSYMLTYKAVDANGKSKKNTFNINIFNDVKPQLSYSKAMPKSATANRKVSLPKITVKGTDEATKLSVYVIRPNGARVEVTGSSVTFTDKGLNKIVVFAYDKYGNSVCDTFDVNVK